MQKQASSLLLVSIGPVQDFISSARRCQDLWFGSWLLSELSRSVAEEIEYTCGKEALVFPPSVDGVEDRRRSVANKILAVIPQDKAVREVAEAGERALRTAVKDIALEAFGRLRDRKYFNEVLAMQQVEDLMEYLWVAVPYSVEDDYRQQRSRAEALLAARKATRTWRQVSGAPVPKSSLDGARESVLHEDIFDPQKEASRSRPLYFVRSGERLCGVGLLKRLGGDTSPFGVGERLGRRRPIFHSTSHVAAGPWRSALHAREGGLEATQRYLDVLRTECHVAVDDIAVHAPRVEAERATLPCPLDEARPMLLPGPLAAGADAGVLYEGRLDILVERGCAVQGVDVAPAQKRAREALRELLKRVGLPAPTAYYALLLADGDSMGKVIDRQESFGAHRRLGAAVEAFASGCRDIVETQHGGSLIYAGGDDVLALLPLHTALQCAQALASFFRERLSEFNTAEPHVTLSVGLAVAHHVVDFAEVREQARRAEKLAKAFNGKNALGIIVQPRSGGSLEAVGGWNERPNLAQRICRWCALFAGEAMPDKVAFALGESVEPLARDATEKDRELIADAARATIKRALARRRRRDDGASLDQEVRLLVETRLKDRSPLEAVGRLSDELQIARYFLEAYDLAMRGERAARAKSREAEVQP